MSVCLRERKERGRERDQDLGHEMLNWERQISTFACTLQQTNKQDVTISSKSKFLCDFSEQISKSLVFFLNAKNLS